MKLPSYLQLSLGFWQKWFIPRATDHDEKFRERTIRGMVMALCIFAVSLIVFHVLTNNISHLYQPIALLAVVIATGFAVHKNRIHTAAWFLVLSGVMLVATSELQIGYWSPGVIASIFFTMMLSSILLPQRSALIAPALVVGLYCVLAVWEQSQGIVTPLDPTSIFATAPKASFGMVCIVAVLTTTQQYLIHEFNSQRRELKDLINSLEDRVEARTRYLGVAAQVSQQVTQVLNLEELLPQLTELTRKSFDLYHVGIYLYEENTQTLRLHAGTGESGAKLVADNNQFNIEDRNLVARTLRERKAQVINNVKRSYDYQANPLLPDTQSQIALPMLFGDNLIGVLDLQSDVINQFLPDDVMVLTTLTEQIAIAVRNANLFAIAHQARQEAEQANRIKSLFLASMSHELRTPLNAILNFTQFVATGMLGSINPEQIDVLEKVVYSGKHLLSLINDILDISKIESGSLKLFIENNIDLAKVGQSVADTARSLLRGKPISLEVDFPDNLPLMTGDKRRIAQIMLNLVSNACKFTDTGNIRIAVEQQQNNLQFSIQDSGPGIAPEDAELIFEVFRQTDNGLRQGEGTGLGLPISRRLAEAHGGRLWFESTLGQGTTFYLSLPVKSPLFQSSTAVSESSSHAA